MKIFFKRSYTTAFVALALFFAMGILPTVAASTIGTDITTDGLFTVDGSANDLVMTGAAGSANPTLSLSGSDAAIGLTVTLKSTGTFIIGTSTANADTLRFLPAAGGAGTFAGTFTSADLTAARTWTLPDSSGTVTVLGNTVTGSGSIVLATSPALDSFTFVNATGTSATTTNFQALTTARLPSNTLINSTSVCLSDGTNCPASAGGTLASVTAATNGTYTTNTLLLYSGFLSASSTVTSSLTVVGTASLLNAFTFVNGTGTSLAVSGAITGGTFNKITITTPASGATLTIANGATLSVPSSATISGTNTGDQTNPSSVKRHFRPSMPPLANGFQGSSGTAYCIYIDYFEVAVVIKYLEVYVAVGGTGSQTAEVAIASSPSAPNKADQTLTVLTSNGTLDALTSGGVKRNTTAFNGGAGYTIPAGTHTWACSRYQMGTDQPIPSGIGTDWGFGAILSANSGPLTATTTFAGTRISPTQASTEAYYMVLTMD